MAANNSILDHSCDLMRNTFEKLYTDGNNSDVTLLVGDRKFSAHRLILATHSNFFQRMFYEEGGKLNVFPVVAPPVAFEHILRYFYSGKMDLNQFMDIHQLLETVELARRYGLKKLEENLRDHVIGQINLENLVPIIQSSELYPKMSEKCVEVVNEHSKEFFESQGFLQLNEKEVSNVFSWTGLVLTNVRRFQAIAAWLKVHECSKVMQEKLIETVDLTLLTNTELIRIVRPTKLVDDETLFNVLDRDDQPKPTQGCIEICDIHTEEIQSVMDLPLKDYKAACGKLLKIRFNQPLFLDQIGFRLWDFSSKNHYFSLYGINGKTGFEVAIKVFNDAYGWQTVNIEPNVYSGFIMRDCAVDSFFTVIRLREFHALRHKIGEK